MGWKWDKPAVEKAVEAALRDREGDPDHGKPIVWGDAVVMWADDGNRLTVSLTRAEPKTD